MQDEAIVTVRLDPEPPSVMPAAVTKPVFEELRLSVSPETGVSGSLIVNGMGPNTAFSFITWLERADTKGAPLTVTVNWRVTMLFCGWPSFTVTVMIAVPLE